MKKDTNTRSICFDDILLVPKKSNIVTRGNIKIDTVVGNPIRPEAFIHLRSPLIMAPMDFITSNAMIEKVISFGGMAILPRYVNFDERINRLNTIPLSVDRKLLGFAISIEESRDERCIKTLKDLGITVFLLEVALGHLKIVVDAVRDLRMLVDSNVHIMVGNVSSHEAYKDLMDAGADSVRVGIGGGAACTTRTVTGFGVPVLSSVMDTYENTNKSEVNGIISDGGIKNNGDVAKALAAGASAVMMGSFFSGHDECDRDKDGRHVFRGSASMEVQKDNNPDLVKDLSSVYVEGVSGFVSPKGPVEYSLNMLLNNIKSALSYSGSENLLDFRENATYIEVSSMSNLESGNRV
jgi:IMP dehydrogenase/GMP reductase